MADRRDFIDRARNSLREAQLTAAELWRRAIAGDASLDDARAADGRVAEIRLLIDEAVQAERDEQEARIERTELCARICLTLADGPIATRAQIGRALGVRPARIHPVMDELAARGEIVNVRGRGWSLASSPAACAA